MISSYSAYNEDKLLVGLLVELNSQTENQVRLTEIPGYVQGLRSLQSSFDDTVSHLISAIRETSKISGHRSQAQSHSSVSNSSRIVLEPF